VTYEDRLEAILDKLEFWWVAVLAVYRCSALGEGFLGFEVLKVLQHSAFALWGGEGCSLC
jgi:hypothetical protein